MTMRFIFLLAGITALLFTSPNVAAHPPEDMPWEAKRNSEYTQKKAEDAADAQKLDAAPKASENANEDATTSDAITATPESVKKTDEVKKKGWFARWKEKREARKTAEQRQENP